ncbi:hypothetical protein MMRN_p1220 (plasmid) [Mycobacterium marinum]|nr:hypothetical protein MMRN_p1220 [Mycobacterium marinum]GJO38715.1 hypothetical protein NJB1604_06310 [Mycobacterium marinum]
MVVSIGSTINPVVPTIESSTSASSSVDDNACSVAAGTALATGLCADSAGIVPAPMAASTCLPDLLATAAVKAITTSTATAVPPSVTQVRREAECPGAGG